MVRKNITIRADQAVWIERSDVNLSRVVRDRLDELMGPTDAAEAYAETVEQARRINREWEPVSEEANEYLGEPPAVEGNGFRWDPENGLRKVESNDSDGTTVHHPSRTPR